jgi:hypothetical protein
MLTSRCIMRRCMPGFSAIDKRAPGPHWTCRLNGRLSIKNVNSAWCRNLRAAFSISPWWLLRPTTPLPERPLIARGLTVGGIPDMAIRTQTKGIAFRLVGATTAMFACLLAECTSPNSADYAAAAADRARQAREESALAEQHAAASAILRDQGDETGAAISHDAADEAARDAYWQRLQAAKDEWLSRWWPVR